MVPCLKGALLLVLGGFSTRMQFAWGLCFGEEVMFSLRSLLKPESMEAIFTQNH